jgi:acetyltransferase
LVTCFATHDDPQFGPVVLGGVFVEVLHDVALRVAPLSLLDAESMLDELRGRPLLEGARGGRGVDRAALTTVLCTLPS